MKLQKKIPLVISVLIFFSITIICILIYYRFSNILISQVKNEMQNSSKGYVNSVESLIEKQQTDSSRLAQSKDVIELAEERKALGNSSSNDMQNKLQQNNINMKKYVDTVNFIEHTFIVDTNGMLYSDSNPLKSERSLADRSYNTPSLNGKPNISDVLVSNSTKALVTVFTSPIIYNNQILGYAGSSVFASSFSTSLSGIPMNSLASAKTCPMRTPINVSFLSDSSNLK